MHRIAISLLFVLILLPAYTHAAICDVDNDGNIDNIDIDAISAAIGAPASGKGDPRDADNNGVISLSDRKYCLTKCTLAGCKDPDAIIPTVNILKPLSLTTVGSTPIQVSGTVYPKTATLTLNGVPVTIQPDVFRSRRLTSTFKASVSLEEGSNTIVARVVNGAVAVTDSVIISMDTTPPYITVETPVEGQIVNSSSIMVSGLINDIVRGTIADNQANVTVNGITAVVSNRSYLAENIPLTVGDNEIIINASDQVGNTSTLTVSVRYEIPAAKRIQFVSGQNQRAKIQTKIPSPLVVTLIGNDGNPVSGKNVIFRVVQGNGVVGVGTVDESQAVLIATDATGQAQTTFKLGSRSGSGNQRVRANAVGFDAEVIFYASADANIGDKISVIAGNNQRGAVGQALPGPFVVAVTDSGSNLIQGATVEFSVAKGTGNFQNETAASTPTYTAITDTDGRASVQFDLGPEVGLDQQQISAVLVGTTAIASFTASGLVAGDPGQTNITGVVLDNQDNPLPGVTMRVDGTTRQGVADEQGVFTISNVPVGPVHLLADGSTTSVAGEWPTLSYNLVTVAGANNPLPAPIYMVKLDTQNAQLVGGVEDVVFTLADLPGFKLTVLKNSVTFPDGTKEGLISVTPVNANKIPMAPPNGMQPQLIVTIQPAGAMFDPPAPLSLPNVDGYDPGAQVEMYSYDHDLEEFVTIGIGSVSADGTVIASNKGVGVIKAGWHCGSSPSGSGCANGCGFCFDCGVNCSCKKIPSRVMQNQSPTDCKTFKCDLTWEPAAEDPGVCKKCSLGTPLNVVDDTSCDASNLCKVCKNGKCERKPDKTGISISKSYDISAIVDAIKNGVNKAPANICRVNADSLKFAAEFSYTNVENCCKNNYQTAGKISGSAPIGKFGIGCDIPVINLIPGILTVGPTFDISAGGKITASGLVDGNQSCCSKSINLTGSVGINLGVKAFTPFDPSIFNVSGGGGISGGLSAEYNCGGFKWNGGSIGPPTIGFQVQYLGGETKVFPWTFDDLVWSF